MTGTLQAAQAPAHTGDVTSSAASLALTIANAAVSLAKMANLAANSIIGNNTGSPATPIALSASQVRTLIGAVNIAGDTMTGGLILPAGTTSVVPLRIPGGVAHSSPTHGDIHTSTGTNLLVYLSGTSYFASFINKAETFTAKKTTLASATGGAGFNLPHGAAPTSPADGDMWTTTAGVYVQINGSTVGPLGTGGGGGSAIATSDTAPGSPTDGTLWYDSTVGQTYVYYDDGTSSQWVPVSSVTAVNINWGKSLAARAATYY